MKKLLLLLLLLLAVSTAQAQSPYTVTGTVQSNTGGLATSGTVTFRLMPSSQSILYFVQGTTIIAPTTSTCGINSSGLIKNAANLTNPCTVWGNDQITPGNTTYTVQFAPNGSTTSTIANIAINSVCTNLNAPCFSPTVNVVPQYQTITTSPIQVNLIPAAAHVFNVGQAGLTYAAGYFDNLFVTNCVGCTSLSSSVSNFTITGPCLNVGGDCRNLNIDVPNDTQFTHNEILATVFGVWRPSSNPVCTITQVGATATVATYICPNLYYAGEPMAVSGLTHTALNGSNLVVATASPTQFTVNGSYTPFALTADSGTTSPGNFSMTGIDLYPIAVPPTGVTIPFFSALSIHSQNGDPAVPAGTIDSFSMIAINTPFDVITNRATTPFVYMEHIFPCPTWPSIGACYSLKVDSPGLVDISTLASFDDGINVSGGSINTSTINVNGTGEIVGSDYRFLNVAATNDTQILGNDVASTINHIYSPTGTTTFASIGEQIIQSNNVGSGSTLPNSIALAITSQNGAGGFTGAITQDFDLLINSPNNVGSAATGTIHYGERIQNQDWAVFTLNYSLYIDPPVLTTSKAAQVYIGAPSHIDNILITERSAAPSGACCAPTFGGSEALYGLTTTHRLMMNPSATGEFYVPGVASSITIANQSGHFAEFASNGLDLQDGGVITTVITTAATSDTVTIAGMSASGHCVFSAGNTSAATNIATTWIDTYAMGSVKLNHTATANMNYVLRCSPN